jgi:hypothetical protein
MVQAKNINPPQMLPEMMGVKAVFLFGSKYCMPFERLDVTHPFNEAASEELTAEAAAPPRVAKKRMPSN